MTPSYDIQISWLVNILSTIQFPSLISYLFNKYIQSNYDSLNRYHSTGIINFFLKFITFDTSIIYSINISNKIIILLNRYHNSRVINISSNL